MTKKELRKISLQYRTLSSQMLKIDSQEEINCIKIFFDYITEVALTRKFTDVDTEEFYCLTCFAEYLGCETEDLKVKISKFKEQGCTLFL